MQSDDDDFDEYQAEDAGWTGQHERNPLLSEMQAQLGLRGKR